MFRSIQLPLVATYAPSEDLSTVGPVVLIGGMIAALTFARIERFALADTQSAAILWMVLAVVAVVPHLLAGRNTALDLLDRLRCSAAGHHAPGFGVDRGVGPSPNPNPRPKPNSNNRVQRRDWNRKFGESEGLLGNLEVAWD